MRNKFQCPLRATIMLATCLVPIATLHSAEPKPKRYRVIFNCDGHAVAKDANGDLRQWIENLFGPLEQSHVDALFWCDGAGGNTANYDSQVLERTGARAGQSRPYIDKWIAEGHDPPRVVVREAKQRGLDVFYSFRINDIHDAFMPDEMATFKEAMQVYNDPERAKLIKGAVVNVQNLSKTKPWQCLQSLRP